MTTNTEPIRELMTVAESAARRAGHIARELLETERTVQSKGFRDIVTDADLAAQSAIVETIGANFPDHGFLTEEDDPTLTTSGPITWIVDPVDGTVNYSRQLPLFCISVAAVQVDESSAVRPVASAVYDPLRDDLFVAGAGHGARLNGRTIQVNTTVRVSDAVFAIDFGHADAVRRASFHQAVRLADEVTTIRAFGSAVLALAWVAAGRLDAYVNNALKPWDLAAGQLLIEEAGGRVSLFDGDALYLDHADYAGLGSNELLHDSLLRILQ